MKAILCREHIYISPAPHDYERGSTARRCRECGWVEHVIVLREIPPGANQLHQMSHFEVAKLRAWLKADAVYLVMESGVNGPPLEHARITVDFRWQDRRLHDLDNGLAGLKGALDGLKGRWIVDDDVDHVEYVLRGHKGTGRPSCVVLSVEALRRVRVRHRRAPTVHVALLGRPMTRDPATTMVQWNGRPLMRYRVIVNDGRFGLSPGDIILCEEMHWAWADEKVASVRRESDGYQPGCSLYREMVEYIGEVEAAGYLPITPELDEPW